jgi:hypothetical protein
LAVVLWAAADPAWAGEVKVSFSNGLVTVVAIDASPRQILGEWARLGQVRITNLDRLAGGPVTLQLTDVPEAQALDTLLRGTAGYVAAPRAVAVPTGSRYDRVLLLPGVAPMLPVIAAAPPPTPGRGGMGRGRPAGLPGFNPVEDDGTGRPRPQPDMGFGAGPRGTGRPDVPSMDGLIVPPPVGFPGMPGAQPSFPMPGPDTGRVGIPTPSTASPNVPGLPTMPTSAPRPGMMTAPPPLNGMPIPVKPPTPSPATAPGSIIK